MHKSYAKILPKITGTSYKFIVINYSLNFKGKLFSEVSKDKKHFFGILGDSEEIILYFRF